MHKEQLLIEQARIKKEIINEMLQFHEVAHRASGFEHLQLWWLIKEETR